MEHPARPGDRLEYRSTGAHNADQLEWVERRVGRDLHMYMMMDLTRIAQMSRLRSINCTIVNQLVGNMSAQLQRPCGTTLLGAVHSRARSSLLMMMDLPRSAQMLGSRSIICTIIDQLVWDVSAQLRRTCYKSQNDARWPGWRARSGRAPTPYIDLEADGPCALTARPLLGPRPF